MAPSSTPARRGPESLILSRRAGRIRRIGSLAGEGMLFVVASASVLAVVFIFIFILKDAVPFFRIRGLGELFTSIRWYPSQEPGEFGALALFFGSAMVTVGAVVFAVALGLPAAVALSDIIPFKLRQLVKPVIEILAAIPSVTYGFFALVVFAPLLQNHGGRVASICVWLVGVPLAAVLIAVTSGLAGRRLSPRLRRSVRVFLPIVLGGAAFAGLLAAAKSLAAMRIASGTNILNVSIILGIMVLPTVASMSEDALQAIGRDMREGSYALGATRAETITKVVIPAAASGIAAAVVLGVMRAVGETMVVWMASGNAAQIPTPWFNVLEPVRTLTATIASDMGEADHVTGSARYHVLFALALCLLVFSFISNLMSEWLVRRSRRKLR